jgi:hypothetical protein
MTGNRSLDLQTATCEIESRLKNLKGFVKCDNKDDIIQVHVSNESLFHIFPKMYKLFPISVQYFKKEKK